ncbi:uncharacterized protein BX664DRAFT_320884 [Halteromyces radiatus]|uniref:uncharacterized protein n=1 Tax=Halteromyces radiatus TaxID=101107 RepID=UPI00221E7677|nr:uncharacterized protein BX664DRAFT_320884 [Halteromyces radiatus]KAI8099264.1 hypothetical protein BX664DRAFT_320884 [Halteromyces radiatus]
MTPSLKFIWTICLSGLACFILLFIKIQWQTTDFVIQISSIHNNNYFSSSSSISDEKFITYLPHSGLHNQRIALINAMVLAKQLNRTLIMPELNMGRANYWRESKKLERQLSECPLRATINKAAVGHGTSCSGYSRYVPSTVSNVFDLSALAPLGIRVTQRYNMGLDYFERVYGASPSDMVYIRDSSRFSYRIYDHRNNTMDIKNFEQRIDIEDLQARSEKIMVFGSLFSSFRLALEKPEWVWLWDHLFTEVAFHHPTVIQQSLDIIGRLGGPGQFVSVHVRTGDGVFKHVMDQTFEQVRSRLSSNMDNNDLAVNDTTLSLDTLDSLESIQDPTGRLDACLRLQPLNPFISKTNSTLNPRLRLIYMATDAPDPRRTLHLLYTEFPCLFSLSDFPDVITNTLSATALSPFVEDQQPSRLGPLLFPLIDAEVASHGSAFVGTAKSTFSKYISYRNNRFLNFYPIPKEL